jgi:hypothetical protein
MSDEMKQAADELYAAASEYIEAHPPTHDEIKWHAKWRVEKFVGDVTQDMIDAGVVTPYEVIEREGNLLMYGGASALWDLLIGAGNVSAFSNANAYIGVGDSSTAAAATQTDLQAATNKLRKAMEATYPQHTDGTGASSNAQIVFRSVFGSTDANFAWAEWGVFNASSAGRMLNRKVESLGTKASGTTWTLTITLSLS